MKTQKFLAYISSSEDCNCSLSHDTDVKVGIFPTREEAIEEGMSAMRYYEPHEHSVSYHLLINALDEQGDSIQTDDECYASAEWDYKKEQWNDIVIN